MVDLSIVFCKRLPEGNHHGPGGLAPRIADLVIPLVPDGSSTIYPQKNQGP